MQFVMPTRTESVVFFRIGEYQYGKNYSVFE